MTPGSLIVVLGLVVTVLVAGAVKSVTFVDKDDTL
jgi:hypothetical protein